MKKFNYLFLLVLTAFAVESCSKVDKIGPELNGVYSKVEIAESLAVSDNTPNFATGERAAFSAKFIKDTYWVLTLTGATSGATKVYEGTSKEINPARIVWDGTADSPASFGAEVVNAKVKFPYSPEDSMSVSITITGARNPNTGGVMVTDFTLFNGGWGIDYPNVEMGVNNNDYPKVNGNYCIMKGTAKPGFGNFAGYLGIEAKKAAPAQASGFFPLYADPAKVYFNMMVYGNGTKSRMRVVLQENGVEARYVDVIPNWSGWKLLSTNYKDFTPSDETNNLYNPQKISGIGLILFSEEENLTDTVAFVFDKMIFTNGDPYQP